MTAKAGLAMRTWSALTWCAAPLLSWHLKKRVKIGKEDPTRWREKLGHASLPRPAGRLIWLNAVGLGEVLALRGLIAQLATRDPTAHFLVTSGTRVSAQVFAENMPERTQHQFLPLDTPNAAKRFLDHWQPDLAIWAEQELWPGLIWRTDERGIALALVNARMNAQAYQKRRRARALFADALKRFGLVSAQDRASADHLIALGARDVQIDGSLKPIAPPLGKPNDFEDVAAVLSDRFVWVVASSHPADENVALAAHDKLLKHMPNALLVLVPRDVSRADEMIADDVGRRSRQDAVTGSIYLADSFGELGLWYRIAQAALIGGSFDATNGHNPWEAIKLGCPVLHGPQVGNFASDYAQLSEKGAAILVNDADQLAKQLLALSSDGPCASVIINTDPLATLCDTLSAMGKTQ